MAGRSALKLDIEYLPADKNGRRVMDITTPEGMAYLVLNFGAIWNIIVSPSTINMGSGTTKETQNLIGSDLDGIGYFSVQFLTN